MSLMQEPGAAHGKGRQARGQNCRVAGKPQSVPLNCPDLCDPGGFFSAVYGASTIAADVVPLLIAADFGAAVDPVSFIGVTLLVAYMSSMLGELARGWPCRARRLHEGPGPAPDHLLKIARPMVFLLPVSTDTVVRLFGADPHAKKESITSEEFWDMVAQSDMLERDSRISSQTFLGRGSPARRGHAPPH